MNIKEKLKEDINCFLNNTKMTRTNFGLGAVNDACLLSRIESGTSPTVRTIDRIYEFMENYVKTEDASSKNSD